MKKTMKTIVLAMMALIATVLLVACGSNQNIQGTWRMNDREQVEALIGSYDDNVDVTITLFVSEDNYFEMIGMMKAQGLFGKTEEESRIFSGKVEKGNLVVNGLDEGDNKVSYKRSDLKLTLTYDGQELVFQKDVKEDSE